MAIQDINPALFVVAVEGIAQRGRGRMDALQIYFLQMLAKRAREAGDEFWSSMTDRESQYLSEVILSAYQEGIVSEDHMLTHALGIGRRRAAPGADGMINANLTSGLRKTMTPTAAASAETPGDEDNGASGGSSTPGEPTTPLEVAASELRGYQAALLERNSFAAQKAWRRFEKACEMLNPRVIAYARVVAINQFLCGLREHLPNAESLINEPGKSDTERLRNFIGHAKALAKLLKYQSKTVEECLDVLPDPDVLLKRPGRQR
jgi:hypothetical protein